jgi:HAD superfamily hydrolase (TIGR01509 family)
VASVALFDLDNTLVDRTTAFRAWAARFAAEHGLGEEGMAWLCAADEDGFARREVLFEGARQHFGLAETVDDLVVGYRRSYPAGFQPSPPVNHALRSLRRSGWRIGVVTNGPPSQREKVERAGLDELVDAVCISEEIGAMKPDRRIFEEALRRCGSERTPAKEVAMVGDAAESDIGGGRSMGFRTVWLHRGRAWPRTDYAPDLSAASVTEAIDLLLAG